MNNYIYSFLCGLLTHPCPYFNGDLAKPPLKFGYGWVITSHRFMLMSSHIHVTSVVLLYQSSAHTWTTPRPFQCRIKAISQEICINILGVADLNRSTTHSIFVHILGVVNMLRSATNSICIHINDTLLYNYVKIYNTHYRSLSLGMSLFVRGHRWPPRPPVAPSKNGGPLKNGDPFK